MCRQVDARWLHPSIPKADVERAFEQFGPINYVWMRGGEDWPWTCPCRRGAWATSPTTTPPSSSATNTRADDMSDDDNNDGDDSDMHESDGMEDDEFDADDFF